MSIAPFEEVAFSELIQRPTETTGKLAKAHAVRLRRRDAGDLVLMPAERVDQAGEIMSLTTRILVQFLRQEGGAEKLGQAITLVLPWAKFLPEDARAEFARELIEVTEAAVSLGVPAPILQCLVEWKHTAEICSDPELLAKLSRSYDLDFDNDTDDDDDDDTKDEA